MTSTPVPVLTAAARILVVVVRYKTPLVESQTIEGLCKAFAMDPALAESYELLVWDNTPEALHDPQLPIPFTYRHTGENLGVSGACNHATRHALEHGNIWMLLFDQDSSVTPDFLGDMRRHAWALAADTDIAAIAPIVKVGKTVVSPKRYAFNRTVVYPVGESCVLTGEAVAINSGCMMRASALKEIGGFSIDFWLDYSDIYVFHQFYLCHKKVWRASDVELQHEMSIMDYDRLMTPWRYVNFSKAESAFNDLYKGRVENLVHDLRLLGRAVKQRFKYKSSEFSRIAWASFRYRITTSRRTRLADWKAENAKRAATS